MNVGIWVQSDPRRTSWLEVKQKGKSICLQGDAVNKTLLNILEPIRNRQNHSTAIFLKQTVTFNGAQTCPHFNM